MIMEARSTNTTTDAPVYSYKPLSTSQKEIRVLGLHPGADKEPVKATLEHVALQDNPEYETISYVWGDASIRSKIYVDGNILDVPSSAERAIRRMRTDTDRVLWIDAVCINQADWKERAQQVSIMGDVYRTTWHNLIWLGDSDETTADAVEAMHAMWTDILLATEDLANFYDAIVNPQRAEKSGDHDQFWKEHRSIHGFFANPWFERLWCVQEVVLAPSSTICCGEFELPLMQVLRIGTWCWHKRRVLGLPESSSLRAFLRARQLFDLVGSAYGVLGRNCSSTRSRSFEMLQLLEMSSELQVSLKHDHVFAVLGLVMSDELPSDLLKVDYAMPLEDVYRQATMAAIIELHGTYMLAKVLHRAHVENADEMRFPSWVPRFDKGWNPAFDALPFESIEHEWENLEAYPAQETDGQKLLQYFGEDPRVLHLWGVRVDCVTKSTSVFSRSDWQSENFVMQEINKMYDTRRQGSDKDDMVETLARTLAVATNSNDVDRLGSVFEEWARGLTAEATPSDGVSRFHVRVTDYCTNRRIFSTSTGIFGLGPSCMRVTDIVVVVCNHPTPLILRPIREDHDIQAVSAPGEEGAAESRTFQRRRSGRPIRTKRYQFIGECYVDGIMRGEAVYADRKAGGVDEEFQIV